MIKIQNYDKKNRKLVFVTDMQTSLANAIRRSALEVPVMAIDEVSIVKNDSALYDEIIAHRIGLVPIETSKSTKEIKFSLKSAGPCTVYSTDIKPSVGTEYKLPITVLENGQELEVVMEARLGKGIEHIKYSPGLIFYRHNFDSEIIDFVNVDEEGKVSFEDGLDSKSISEELKKKIRKAENNNELLFEIESWGQIDAKDIFLRAIEALDENLEELGKKVK